MSPPSPHTPSTKAALLDEEEYNAVFAPDGSGSYIGYPTYGFNVDWQEDYGNPPSWCASTTSYIDSERLCDKCEEFDFRGMLTSREMGGNEEERGDREKEVEGKAEEEDEGKGAALNVGFNIRLGTVKDLLDRAPTCSFCDWVVTVAAYAYFSTGAPLAGICTLKKDIPERFFSAKYATICIDCTDINTANPESTQYPYIERELCLWPDQPEERPNAPLADEEPRAHFFPFMALFWLYQGCVSLHPKCRAAMQTNKKKLSTVMFVVDLHDFCIVPAPDDCVYAALSYVWGAEPGEYDTNIISSSSETRVEFPERFSPTIIHACNVAKQWGFRYLWVDQLCVPQDRRQEQILEMDAIYRNAELTILAAVEDASAGLPGVGETNRKRRAPPVLRVKGCNVGLKVPINSFLAIGEAVYSTRGWTYQEKVLSVRLLIISEEDIYYKCIEGEKGEMECHKSNIIEFSRETAVEFGGVLATAHGRVSFQIYGDCVDEYSGRNLSRPSDILNAFAGLMSFLADKYEWRFVWGLPDENFLLALLWTAPVATRRVATDSKGRSFPSWSWAGWNGRTRHYGVRPKGLVQAQGLFLDFVPVTWKEDMLVHAEETGLLVLDAECATMTEENIGTFRTTSTDWQLRHLGASEVPHGSVFVAIALLADTDPSVKGLIVAAKGEVAERIMIAEIEAKAWMEMPREVRHIKLA